MSLSPLRSFAFGLDDAMLATIASRGLLRRALVDEQAGLVTINSETEREADLMVESAAVHLDAAGIARCTCTCPAVSVCRHQLAAILHLRRLAEVKDRVADRSAPTDWRALFEAFTPEDLEQFAGKPVWRDVLEQDRPEPPVEFLLTENSLMIRPGSTDPAVLFLPTGGLDAAVTKADTRVRKQVIARATIAARRALGLPDFTVARPVKPCQPADDALDSSLLAEIRLVLETAYSASLAVSPASVEHELRRLSLAGRVEALPDLSALLRRLAGAVGALARREAGADTDEVLRLMASIYALCVALGANPGEDLRTRLVGQSRQDYADIGRLDLIGLGARLWATPSGAHGVTSYFADPVSGESYSVTVARPDRTDPQFSPDRAFHSEPIWGHKMVSLCASRVSLANAQLSGTGRLSTSSATAAAVEKWTPTADLLKDSPVCFDDWRALETHLRAKLRPRLGSAAPRDLPVVLCLSRHVSARFDELTQILTWPVGDSQDRWLGLSLAYHGVERKRISVLEHLIRSERFWAVLAVASAEEDRIVLRPYGLWGTEQYLLDFPFLPRVDPTSDGGRLDRLVRISTQSTAGLHQMMSQTPVTDIILGRAWNALLRRIELGAALPWNDFCREAGALSEPLRSAGLSFLGHEFGLIANAPQESVAACCLRAGFAILSTRRARARLPWMR